MNIKYRLAATVLFVICSATTTCTFAQENVESKNESQVLQKLDTVIEYLRSIEDRLSRLERQQEQLTSPGMPMPNTQGSFTTTAIRWRKTNPPQAKPLIYSGLGKRAIDSIDAGMLFDAFETYRDKLKTSL